MHINVWLFDGFETLDAFGPVEVFGTDEAFELGYYSHEGGTITSRHGFKVETRPIGEAPRGALLLPGGPGTRALVQNAAFLQALADCAATQEYCLTVCTGSAVLAAAGALENRRATSNKKSWPWVVTNGNAVDWVYRARYVRDGNIYTSSGVSAGIDMALCFVADVMGREKAQSIADYIEYVWNDDADRDDFAALYDHGE